MPLFSALKTLIFPIKSSGVEGLIHIETMSVMRLGASVFSVSRFFTPCIAVFAQWENQQALHQFLDTHPLGKRLSGSWYLTLKWVRQWGQISGYKIPCKTIEVDDNQLVVVVTLAKMKYCEIPRFLRWGRPVEKMIRDHYGKTLALASFRFPNLISTFTIWKSLKQMNEMVYGSSKTAKYQLHKEAMKENNRKGFHWEFTTLRFVPLAEHGTWNGKSGFTLKDE